jgi:hypothetical protein
MRSADTLQRLFPRHSACDPGSSLGLLRLTCTDWCPFSSQQGFSAALVQQFIPIFYDHNPPSSTRNEEAFAHPAFCRRYPGLRRLARRTERARERAEIPSHPIPHIRHVRSTSDSRIAQKCQDQIAFAGQPSVRLRCVEYVKQAHE